MSNDIRLSVVTNAVGYELHSWDGRPVVGDPPPVVAMDAEELGRADRVAKRVLADLGPVIDGLHLERQRAFSLATFGPGDRLKGVLDHIRKELDEVAEAPHDVSEWADLVILALDGALRQGHEPRAIIEAVLAKQERNEGRIWPDWRTADPDKAIEHDRSAEGYTVVEGDTLWGIADRLLGDGRAWRAIYEANEELISTDERNIELRERYGNGPAHWIFPGQVFTIPEVTS